MPSVRMAGSRSLRTDEKLRGFHIGCEFHVNVWRQDCLFEKSNIRVVGMAHGGILKENNLLADALDDSVGDLDVTSFWARVA